MDSGPLAESWRQQPGSPVYCTSLNADQVKQALARAQKDRIPRRRNLAIDVIMDRADDPSMTIDAEYITELNRLIYG